VVRGLWCVVLGITLAGCRFEERSPSGSRRDDLALERTVTAFYRALATRDTAALRDVTFAGGSALLDVTGSDVTLVPLGALLGVPERRTLANPPRQIRSEVRMDGTIASVRVVLVATREDGVGELETTDLLTLGRREGQWRIAHTQLGSWRNRSAP
jgi:hypothetical protein